VEQQRRIEDLETKAKCAPLIFLPSPLLSEPFFSSQDPVVDDELPCRDSTRFHQIVESLRLTESEIAELVDGSFQWPRTVDDCEIPSLVALLHCIKKEWSDAAEGKEANEARIASLVKEKENPAKDSGERIRELQTKVDELEKVRLSTFFSLLASRS
jgi:hypothetical protein